MSDTQTISRKIQIFPVGDKEEINRVYKYIKEGMFNQNKAMNQYISALFMSYMQEISKEDRKELNQLYSRISSSKKGSAYSLDIEFAKGLPMGGSISQKVKQDFSKSVKDGLLYGKVSLPTYKKDNPLLVHVDYVRLRSTNPHLDNGLYHEYGNHQEFLSALKNERPEIFIKFANNILFKVVFGNPHKSQELRCVIQNIFEENYKVQGSSIQFDKTGKKIILNLSLAIPKQKHELDENTVVGVDLGQAIPAVCGLNNDTYAREYIGSIDDFLRVRTQIQAQKRRLQKSLKNSNGGHGRKKKMKPMDRFTEYESNFVQTYNHMVSKRVVDFALKHNAKYINIENLRGYDTSKFILRNWSYYQLQQYITYKANIHGIEVRYINPCYTSQVCSFCGHWEEGQRKDQPTFVCGNENCNGKKADSKREFINADFNAARNIAKSTLFMDGSTEITHKDMKEAREYYGIPEKLSEEIPA